MESSLRKPDFRQYGLLLLFLFLSVFFGGVAALYGGVAALLLFLPVLPVILTIRDYRIGLFILIALAPFEHTKLLPSLPGFNVINYLTLFIVISFVLHHGFKKEEMIKIPRYVWLLFILPIILAGVHGLLRLKEIPVSFIMDVNAVNYLEPRKYIQEVVIKPLLYIVFGWMLGNALLTSKRPERYLAIFVLGPLLPAAMVIIYLALGGFSLQYLASPAARYQLSNIGLHPTQYGLMFASVIAMQLFMIPWLEGWKRVVVILSVVFISVACLLTFSRIAYFSVFMTFIYFLYKERKGSYFVVMGVIAFFILLFFGEHIYDRLMTGISTHQDTASWAGKTAATGDLVTAGRVYLWGQLLPEVVHNPILGSGVGSVLWSETVRRGILPATHAHNIYLNALLDMGAMGLVLLLIFYQKVFMHFKRLANLPGLPSVYRGVFLGGAVAFSMFLITGFFDNRYIPSQEQLYFWLLYGAGLGVFARFSHGGSGRNAGR
jgi:O-antigen ligase